MSVYSVYSDLQSGCIPADVTGRELNITDHMSLNMRGNPHHMSVTNSDNQGVTV